MNRAEGFFSIFKRGMTGIYQHCGEQHLHRYLAEFDFRYSTASSASPIGGLVAKKKRPEPPALHWPDGSPYVEPIQLVLPFI